MDDIAAVTAALAERAAGLRARLLDQVSANLHGGVLRARSGALAASVAATLDLDADGLTAAVGSAGVPYAAIQEHGGATPAHLIVPVKARALAFAGVGGAVVARAVRHPGSVIPARAPFGTALDALAPEIANGLKEAVLGALGAS